MSATLTYRQMMHQVALLSNDQQVVWECLLSKGPATRKILSVRSGKSLQNVCGRVGDLLDFGMVFTTEAAGGQIVTADPNPDNWEDRAEERKRQKQIKRISEFSADFSPYLSASGKLMLDNLASKVRIKPL